MEVKVGIQMTPRELVVETDVSPSDIEQALADALADNRVFKLTDNRGNTVLIPAGKVAYIEVGSAEPRRVGFGT